VAIVLSLLAALSYGAADYVGGFVSKRNAVFRVVFVSQVIGALPLLLIFPLLNTGVFSGTALWWGCAAGVAGGIGVVLLYRGLARGRMSVVAPITSVEAAAVPVLFGLISGERPSGWALIGVAVALLAVTLVSSSSEGTPSGGSSGIPEAIAAGAAFGVFFIVLDQAGDSAGMWPILSMRATSLVLVAIAMLVTKTSIKPAEGTLSGIALSGVLDVAANVLYLLSTQHGLLSLVAVITSMYPATTVLLARFFLKERLTKNQVIGLGMAAVGVTLIALG
jgi:drug/metabolite transporter (DMT)-like permease